jgi:hypothetical protein
MKKTKQNRNLKANMDTRNRVLKMLDNIYNSTWGIGALLAAISAWTAGILYV